jgi:hypothetical protein
MAKNPRSLVFPFASSAPPRRRPLGYLKVARLYRIQRPLLGLLPCGLIQGTPRGNASVSEDAVLFIEACVNLFLKISPLHKITIFARLRARPQTWRLYQTLRRQSMDDDGGSGIQPIDRRTGAGLWAVCRTNEKRST